MERRRPRRHPLTAVRFHPENGGAKNVVLQRLAMAPPLVLLAVACARP
ncbi:MAG: hypothetical protein WCT05_02665 [Lentisphaeria bacterium]